MIGTGGKSRVLSFRTCDVIAEALANGARPGQSAGRCDAGNDQSPVGCFNFSIA
jgi:hypothetical protein